nr:hypothetical protein [Pantoea cypripedii]
MAEFQHHRAGGRAKVRWRAPLQSAPCGVLAQRFALFPRLKTRRKKKKQTTKENPQKVIAVAAGV